MSEGRTDMAARIYKPARNVMQSGKGKAGRWVLEYPPETRRRSIR